MASRSCCARAPPTRSAVRRCCGSSQADADESKLEWAAGWAADESEEREALMPEYLAPGVYVEEVSYRAKSIEGVSTTTTGFVGPTRSGPIDGEPELLTSFSHFERIYGGLDQLVFATSGAPG